MDRGTAYAEACFETFRVIDGQCFAWSAHQQRLATGLAAFGIKLNGDDYRKMYTAAIDAAKAVASDALVRLTVTGGEASWGLISSAEPKLFIQVMPYHTVIEAVTLTLREWPFPLKQKQAKFISDYAETLRALHGTRELNQIFAQQGVLIAAATANILLYRKGQWWTPGADTGVLPGVVRGHLITKGVVREAACPTAWLDDCETIALCSSGMFIRRVAEITDMYRFDPQHPAYKELIQALAGETGVPKELYL